MWLRATVPVLLLAACYAPSVAPGAPCDPAINNCPSGVECLPAGGGYTCGGLGAIDAALDDAGPDSAIDAIDAPVNLDLDGDGVVNTNDNCPQVANVGQYNEDADGLGDACDPCPVSTTNADLDMDGVGDDCDPRPTIAGDTIVLFEGFGGAMPAGWSGTGGTGVVWSVAGGELRLELASNVVAAMRTNVPGTARMTAATSVVVDQLFGAGTSVGIMNPYAGMMGGGGILCSLYQPAAGSRFLSLYEQGPDVVIDNHAFAFADDVPHVLISARTDNSYLCASEPGPSAPPSGIAGSVGGLANPVIGLRSEGGRARFQWLLVVRSP